MEVEVYALKESLDEHKQETAKGFLEVNNKLDDLLALRNKGVGAFWLASSLMGTGVLSFIYWLFGVK